MDRLRSTKSGFLWIGRRGRWPVEARGRSPGGHGAVLQGSRAFLWARIWAILLLRRHRSDQSRLDGLRIERPCSGGIGSGRFGTRRDVRRAQVKSCVKAIPARGSNQAAVSSGEGWESCSWPSTKRYPVRSRSRWLGGVIPRRLGPSRLASLNSRYSTLSRTTACVWRHRCTAALRRRWTRWGCWRRGGSSDPGESRRRR